MQHNENQKARYGGEYGMGMQLLTAEQSSAHMTTINAWIRLDKIFLSVMTVTMSD